LEGVARIGAVNCGDEWVLCRQQGIRSYPSLVTYPKVSTITLFFIHFCSTDHVSGYPVHNRYIRVFGFFVTEMDFGHEIC